MEFAFGVLKISPDVFWNMTMIEFLSSFEGYRSTMPKRTGSRDETITRTDLEEMMHMFPD